MTESPAEGTDPKKATYRFIDGLRGYAIALVLLVHAGLGTVAIDSLDKFDPAPKTDILLPTWLRAICDAAGNGVQLFFVVSAASLTLSLLGRHGTDLRRYARRRFCRIAPMFYVGLAFYLFLFGFGPRMWAMNGIGWRDVLQTLLLVHAWFPNALNSVVPGGWSIGDEVSFYVLLPALFVLLRRSRLAFLVLAAAVLVAVQTRYAIELRSGAWTPYKILGFINQSPVFLVGMLAAWAFRFHPLPRIVNSQVWGPLVFVVMVAVLPQVAGMGETVLQSHLRFALLGGLLCYALSGDRSIFFTKSAIVSLGRVSFSVYLIHFALLRPMHAFAGMLTSSRGVVFLLIDYAALLAVAYALAVLTYRYVEHPFIRLGAGEADPFRVWRELLGRTPALDPTLGREGRR
ncbi:MAG: acyltransferase [Hyphomicrobiales bacterium]|nr:acyltransferase [Hyphomicrobiales bacterium]